MIFFNNADKKEIEQLTKEVDRLHGVIHELHEALGKTKKITDEYKKDLQKIIDDLKKDHQIEIDRKDAEVDVKISTAVKEKDTKIAKLELENGIYKKEVEILTKAFENLGFDVKDMKEILNKLVDGIVSKNTVNLIK